MPQRGEYNFDIEMHFYKEPITDHRSSSSQKNFRKITCIQRFEFVVSVINRLLIGFVTVYMCWMCLRLDPMEIPWHAVLCTLGFLCLMAEGITAHYRGNTCTQLCHRPEKSRTHWILQLLGSILGIIGIAIKMYLQDSHFQSAHACCGLATFILCMLSLVSGLASLYANELRHQLQPLINKALHNILGLATFTLAMLSMYTAFETDIFLEHSIDATNFIDFRLLLQTMTFSILTLSGYGPLWCLVYSKLWKC